MFQELNSFIKSMEDFVRDFNEYSSSNEEDNKKVEKREFVIKGAKYETIIKVELDKDGYPIRIYKKVTEAEKDLSSLEKELEEAIKQKDFLKAHRLNIKIAETKLKNQKK